MGFMGESGKKKKTSRDIQAEKSRERIYKVASSLISRKGFYDTSISEICREAQCSVGAFYHHFSSKDSILEETFRLADIDFAEWEVPDQQILDGKELVLLYMTSYADLIEQTGLNFIKRFYNNGNKTFIKQGRPMQTRLVEIIESSAQNGKLAIRDTPAVVCEKIFIAARGVVFHWCLHEGGFDLKTLLLDMVSCVLADQEYRP